MPEARQRPELAMSPHLFRQQLLELAAEYELLHAGRVDRTLSAQSSVTPGSPLEQRRASFSAASSISSPGLASQTEAAFDQIWSGANGQADASEPPGGDGERSPADGAAGGAGPPSGVGEGAAQAAGGASVARSASPRRKRAARAARHRLKGLVGTPDTGGIPSPSSNLRRSGSATPLAHTPSTHGERLFNTAVRRTEHTLHSHSMNGFHLDEETPVVRMVKSRGFNIGIACLIVASIVMIGIETQLLSSLSRQGSGSKQWSTALSATNYAFTAMFTVEIVVRLYAFRLDFFVYERVWNLFDIVILLLALIEVALELAVHSFADGGHEIFDTGGSAKILRLLRLTRLLRLVRTFRQLKPLRVLLHSLYCAGKSVFWALLLLLIVVFSFGVVLTQAVTEHTEGGTRIEDDNLMSYYGNLYRSMISLWWAVSGGISWNELVGPLEGIGDSVWVIMFLAYIVFVYFFIGWRILNVVTGVFCQSAIEGAQQDLELTVETQNKKRQEHTDRLRMLFKEMNEFSDDGGDGLTAAEVHEQLARPRVQAWFTALDVDVRHAWKFFNIIDAEKSGRVSLEDFVEGCLKLRGAATRVDVESLKWEIRWAHKRAEHTARVLVDVVRALDPHATSRETLHTSSLITGDSSV
ncbi:unnamed protein product [Prorocentrum cordatum]|uniref:EF-hand domain-containing protein n=1 Tax=Prorocentrum cordatum TaxID=2364126 RepID=A0ABN9U8B8_9DINO|nr:unnamed protein product [Polarella glacialis]